MITTNYAEIDTIEFSAELAAFRQTHPAFDATSKLDELRAPEYARLLLAELDQARPDRQNLFADPAQSNFSGAQHPLEWIAHAQARVASSTSASRILDQ
jgi:selenocysteine lyase/cysteine desulfurase